jgi:outer membrane protein assembly factor BamB
MNLGYEGLSRRREPHIRFGRRGPSLLVMTVTLGVAAVASAAEWPQWRGPTRDGIWAETGIVERFAGPQLPIRWRAEVASGYSGPTVAEGRVFITDRLTKPDELERVHCFDADTGASLWSYSYACEYRKVGYEAGPRAAVTIDDGRAYALGTMGHLHCFEAATGNVVWKRDLFNEYQIRMPVWGIAAAPLIEDDLVIVMIGGDDGACLVAFDKASGQERWRALKDGASYSAPVIIRQAGHRVLVCITGERVVGLNPLSGELHWHHPFPPSRMTITIATPVLDNGTLLATSFYDGMLALRVDPDALAVEELWRRLGPNERNTDALHCCISTPIIEGDYIYGVDSYGELRCLELKTGDRIWEDLTATPKARWSNIHMVRHGDKIWMFNERGELIISTLSPEGFREISRTKLIEPTKEQLSQRGGVCWAHPAFAYKRVYARNDVELVCADLAAR